MVDQVSLRDVELLSLLLHLDVRPSVCMQFIADAVREKMAREKFPLTDEHPSEARLFMGLDEHEIMGIEFKLEDLKREIQAGKALINSLINALVEAVEHQVPEERAEEMRSLCWKVKLSERLENLITYWSNLRMEKPGAALGAQPRLTSSGGR